MKIVLVLFMCLFSTLVKADFCNTSEHCECMGDNCDFYDVEFIECYDGDTCKFNISYLPMIYGKNISIRLNGIDTPEKRTKDKCEKSKARTAERLVNNLLKNSDEIWLKNCFQGKYRTVCDIMYRSNDEDKNLSKILLKNNLGYVYNGGKKKKINWCSGVKNEL